MCLARYLYLTAIPDQNSDLIKSETVALVEAIPNSLGIAISEKRVDVSRGAYVKMCVDIIFEGEHISEIINKIKDMQLHVEGFRVSVARRPRKLKTDSKSIARHVGAAIGGNPNLDHPSINFLVLVTETKIYFGSVSSESDGKWYQHKKRPYSTSSSLPTRLARTVVNLTANPGEYILDPCCGTGTILIEAALMGIKVSGYDNNNKMVEATRRNLAHYNLQGEINLADATQIRGNFDAVITDLPYGITLTTNKTQERKIMQNIRHLAPKTTFVAIRDLTTDLLDLGYRIQQHINAKKHTITRQIFVTEANQ